MFCNQCDVNCIHLFFTSYLLIFYFYCTYYLLFLFLKYSKDNCRSIAMIFVFLLCFFTIFFCVIYIYIAYLVIASFSCHANTNIVITNIVFGYPLCTHFRFIFLFLSPRIGLSSIPIIFLCSYLNEGYWTHRL